MTCTLINGDCLEEMDKLIDNNIKVDCIITDLPYGTTRNEWDSIIPLNEMWNCFNELCNETSPIILFSQLPFTILLAQSNIKDLRYEWIWVKEQGTGHLNSKRMPLKSHENILVFYKSLPYYNPQMRGNEKRIVKRESTSQSSNYGKYHTIGLSEYTGRYPIDVLYFNRDKSRVHPTQKPIKLIEYLIKTYSKENDLILDCCMGGGELLVLLAYKPTETS